MSPPPASGYNRHMPYTSEFTQFLQQLKQQRPNVEADQQRGRAIWWDKKLDLELLERQRAARIPKAPYDYQTKG